MKKYSWIAWCFLLFLSCKDEVEEATIPEFAYSGGETTFFNINSNAFSTPAPNLSSQNLEKHFAGDLAFEQVFVTAPAEVNPGLGPLFNNNSCVSCHIRNGRSTASENGEELSGFLLRMSIPGKNDLGGPLAVPGFGTQLQNRAIFGQQAEGSFDVDYIESLVQFVDNSSVSLQKPIYRITDTYKELPSDVVISPRVAPFVMGIGLLEAIPESDILSRVDETDSDQDGISGRANMVWDIESQSLQLGRFGWKAENTTALQQTADAYHQDMGVTSSLFPEESCFSQSNCQEFNEIDIDDITLDVTTFYIQTLAIPAVRDYENNEVLRGKELFDQLKCNSCHTPKHVTGAAIIPELSNQVIYPYTDLLLHDMGEGLADNRSSFRANGQEWRTPPLWGIGLIPVVNGHSQLLHDGRARNVEEAILWHGGEADQSKNEYIDLSKDDRNALIRFVNSL